MANLCIENLVVAFPTLSGVVTAVDGANLELTPGQRVGFVGESGSGKTTTALAVMRMVRKPGRIASGSIRLGQTDLLTLGPDAIRKARLARVTYVPQGAMNSLNPVLPIGAQIKDGIVDHEGKLSANVLEERIAAALEGVGLPAPVAQKYPHELSGGMKQRACIAIATALNPEVIIADEPTSALDVVTQRQVMETLRSAQEAVGAALILIGHDMGLMAQCVDEIYVMRHGKIVESGKTAEIFENARHAYTRQLIQSVPSLGGKSFLRQTDRPYQWSQPARDEPLLELCKVSKSFGDGLFGGRPTRALAALSLKLTKNHPTIVSIVGQSGSGKSTLGRMVLGFERPTQGTILFEGTDIVRQSRAQSRRFRRDVQAVFQDPYGAFNPFYKVTRALSQPLKHFGIANTQRERYQLMHRACEDVGLDADQVLDRYAHELSGGQRQRLMVARALMLSPKLLIADEPVSMVDASLRATILQSLYDLKEKYGISILYITHDLATAYHVSDYIIVLSAGRVVEAGSPREVIGNPAHPYTQLLIDSVPWPDVRRRWGRSSLKADLEELETSPQSDKCFIRDEVRGVSMQPPADAGVRNRAVSH